MEIYLLKALPLPPCASYSAATLYRPRASFYAISRAFASPGLNAYWSIGPLLKQKILFKAFYKKSKLFSSIVTVSPLEENIKERGDIITLYFGNNKDKTNSVERFLSFVSDYDITVINI